MTYPRLTYRPPNRAVVSDPSLSSLSVLDHHHLILHRSIPYSNFILMSNYPVPPPSYGSAENSPKRANFTEDAEPLLGGQRFAAGPSSGNAIYEQPAFGDIPDDFKVRYTSDRIFEGWR